MLLTLPLVADARLPTLTVLLKPPAPVRTVVVSGELVLRILKGIATRTQVNLKRFYR